MRSSRLSFLLCVFLSAALHAALIWKLRQYATGTTPWVPKKKTQQTVPTVTILPPPKPESPWGEAGGHGEATVGNQAEKVQSSPKPDDLNQAAFTRDPTGQGPVHPPQQQQAPQQPKPLEEAVNSAPPAALPTPPPSKLPSLREPTKPSPQTDKPQDNPTKPQQPTPPVQTTPPTPQGGRPMPHSDRDADPFAKETSVEFQPGRVTARNGRVIKFARPTESLSAFADGASIALPAELVLLVDVDETGRPRDVQILRSTGSSSMDQVLRLAAYASWFEPMKDANGKPMRGKSKFTIGVR